MNTDNIHDLDDPPSTPVATKRDPVDEMLVMMKTLMTTQKQVSEKLEGHLEEYNNDKRKVAFEEIRTVSKTLEAKTPSLPLHPIDASSRILDRKSEFSEKNEGNERDFPFSASSNENSQQNKLPALPKDQNSFAEENHDDSKVTWFESRKARWTAKPPETANHSGITRSVVPVNPALSQVQLRSLSFEAFYHWTQKMFKQQLLSHFEDLQ